jgi:hypothetical protein
VSIFKNFPPKQYLHERRSGLSVAAESLIAQLHSQGKLITPGRENRKIWHENEILKANERLHNVKVSNYTNKHVCKSRETIPLNTLDIAVDKNERHNPPLFFLQQYRVQLDTICKL